MNLANRVTDALFKAADEDDNEELNFEELKGLALELD